MTGFGEARCQRDGLAVAIEVRAINSRFFKLSLRTAEGYGALEPQIEALVRQWIRRGTIQLNLRVDRTRAPDQYCINADVLDRYRRQIEALRQQWGWSGEVSLDNLLLLPGAVEDASSTIVDTEADWPVIQETVEAALRSLSEMRREEGRAMAADLAGNCRVAGACVDKIAKRAPLVVEAYRARLEDRLTAALAERDLTLNPADLIREVGLFAERGDISEEILRLRSHLDQFQAFLEAEESSGRKLEFLTQEMFREANTIGSKANDVEITREVIEIKAAVERIREMIQNVE